MGGKPNREADMQHRIAELEEQLKAAKASTAARVALREYIEKHPALTHVDVSMIAAEMRAPGRFTKMGRAPAAAVGAIGKAMRTARHAKGLSTTEAAEQMGVHIASVSGWERGANQPSEEQHAKIKRVLGVDVAALLAKAKKAANGAAVDH